MLADGRRDAASRQMASSRLELVGSVEARNPPLCATSYLVGFVPQPTLQLLQLHH